MTHHQRITDQQRDDFIYGPISPTQIREDVVKALDQIYALRIERMTNRLWLKLLGGVVAAEGATLAWLATHLFDCLQTASRLVAKVL